MGFSFLDFLVGFLLMNAMPHMLFGLFGIRFISLFGFSRIGNFCYALLNIIAGLWIFLFQHGLGKLADNGVIIGVLAILFIYMIIGKFFYNLFRKKTE